MNRTHDWLRQAEADLKAARDLLATANFAWACFTAQQSAEKALNALLLQCGKEVPSHSMVDLLKALVPHQAVPPEVTKAANTLNRYYIATRYPGAFASGAPADQYFRPDAEEAVDLAAAIYDFAQRTVGSAGPPAP